MTDTIVLHGQEVTREQMADFKRLYEAAVARGDDEYDYYGQTVVTSYAKYVVEYAESNFGDLSKEGSGT